MSYYYNYCIGYAKDGKIFPLGPYNGLGKLRYVISRSSSFASCLHEYFYDMPENKISDELRKDFEYKSVSHEMIMPHLKYLPFTELPSGSFVKKGYFLIEDVKKYEKCKEDMPYFDGFYDVLEPTVYAAMMQNELVFGKAEEKGDNDEEEEEYHSHPASDYMYYAYEDYNSEEYESHMIRNVADMLVGYGKLPDGSSLVVIEEEG